MTSEPNSSSSSTYCSPALEDAWRRFGDFDKNASLAQKRFLSQRKWITMLGVIVTILAVLNMILETSLTEGHWFAQMVQSVLPGQFEALRNVIGRGLNLIIIIIPILISILVAGAVKFNMGISWVMLRSASESIKHEIYKYRTQVGIYNPNHKAPSGKSENRDVTLARRIKDISKRVMETQVNMSELEIYDYKKEGLPPMYGVSPGDDGFTDLTPDQYVHWRLEDQFDYYRSKAKRLAKELQRFQWSIYIIGGLGTLLAAIQMEIWVAVTSAIVAALGSFLEFKRVETNLIGMNLAASDLYDVRAWWRALSNSEKQQASNKATLVKSAEGIIQGENSSWLTEMREALSEVYGDEDGEDGEDNNDIAVLPENVIANSESAASATSAFDSIVKGEGGSWLSMMQSSLADKVQSNGASADASKEEATEDSDADSEVSPMDEAYASGTGAEGEMAYEEPTYDDLAYSDSDYEFEGVAGEEGSLDDTSSGAEAFVDDPMMDGDFSGDDASTDAPEFSDESAAAEDANWLDTPTTFDTSLDSMLNEDGSASENETSASADDSDIAAMATDDGLNGSSVYEAALHMDLPNGYEEDLKAFSDPLAEEFAPAPFARPLGEKPDDDDDEDDDVQANVSELGEFVMAPFQRAPGDKPDDDDEEDDDVQANVSELGEFVMAPFQRASGDIPDAERENSEGQTV
jgi:hypothetical protein